MYLSMKYNKRQQAIIDFARTKDSFQTKDVLEAVGKEYDVKRLTIVRDLDKLTRDQILRREGAGRSVHYTLSPRFRIAETIEVESYFSVIPEKRNIIPFFNYEIFKLLSDGVFTEDEIRFLEGKNQRYREQRAVLTHESPAILRREWERLIVEFSWKSSEIEGNTYTLLETEALIKEHEYAKGKDKAEAQMILNHKTALDFILQQDQYLATYDEEKAKTLHSLLVVDMDISIDFRNHPVGIGGTLYRPLGKKEAISEAMNRLTNLISIQKNAYEKAFLALILISYIQPFEDGNKRISRIVANAILHAQDCAMMSYRNVEVSEYKKAALLFYEQNNIHYFKKIFIEQFVFSADNYFL